MYPVYELFKSCLQILKQVFRSNRQLILTHNTPLLKGNRSDPLGSFKGPHLCLNAAFQFCKMLASSAGNSDSIFRECFWAFNDRWGIYIQRTANAMRHAERRDQTTVFGPITSQQEDWEEVKCFGRLGRGKTTKGRGEEKEERRGGSCLPYPNEHFANYASCLRR